MFRDRDGWRVQWYAHGKRRSKKFTCPKAARRFEMELELGTADQSPSNRTSPTFKDFAERWMREYARVEKSESTWSMDKSTIARYLVPAFGGTRLIDLRRAHIKALKADLRERKVGRREKPLHPKTINNLVLLAKKIMATAVEMELIPVNPFSAEKLLRSPEPTISFWTIPERDRFLDRAMVLDPDFARVVAVACHTGLRRGELIALRRCDLDFERRKIAVVASYNLWVKKRLPTKNKCVADVPMNQAVYQALSPKRFLQAEASVFELSLFHNARRRLRDLCKKTGVRSIRFHDLRHTFASTLAMAGVDLMLIQKLMRHKSYQMTLRYAHLSPSHLLGATDVLCGTQTARRATN